MLRPPAPPIHQNRPIPQPVKQRCYPRAMTIALGILAGNSHILAADTQVNADTDKLSQGKIHFLASQSGPTPGVIAITGAGDDFLLRAIQEDLADLFSRTHTENMHELEVAMAGLVKTFYRDHIALTPIMEQRPEVELIIAARRGAYSGMWTTRKNKLTKAHSPVCVGIGGTYADSLLANMELPQQPETAMILAAYTVFLVKKRNLYVGMDTQVYCLDESTVLFPKGLGTAQCRHLEELFRSCIGVEARVLHRMFGSKYDFCERERVSGDIEKMREMLCDLHPNSPSSSESSQT